MTENVKENPVAIQVRIDKLMNGNGPIKAFASVTIGNAFAVHDIRIAEKNNEIRVWMPSRSYSAGGEKKYIDTFHPITAESRAYLQAAVKEAYEQAQENQMAALEHEESPGMAQQM